MVWPELSLLAFVPRDVKGTCGIYFMYPSIANKQELTIHDFWMNLSYRVMLQPAVSEDGIRQKLRISVCPGTTVSGSGSFCCHFLQRLSPALLLAIGRTRRRGRHPSRPGPTPIFPWRMQSRVPQDGRAHHQLRPVRAVDLAISRPPNPSKQLHFDSPSTALRIWSSNPPFREQTLFFFSLCIPLPRLPTPLAFPIAFLASNTPVLHVPLFTTHGNNCQPVFPVSAFLSRLLYDS